ncbi:3-oxoacyl-ACP synthase III family protein [Aquimarina hainanensis]|uniref:3-oxoacyl-ACP synthase III family protein n=1 Tax=Aquimarina hainanensis TaxID=1578017 RepID=A0ABW5N984_9FLAO|nr:ketoacyl-ACP synthase III [Aquimarina sp. TRL1]QKX05481.1 ketoacyl-ACP synthase III [Aquimarina sp. TRL1]
MVASKISQLAYYLPTATLSNEELQKEFPELDIDKTESKLGIKKRHISAQNETALDLAVKASENVLSNFDKEAIDFVILCTQSPDYFLPTSACILQDRLQLKKDIGALDYNLGCSGFVYGLAMAKGLIKGNIASNVLLVTAETYSKYLHKRDRGNRSIFGDGATATIISSSDKEQIMDFVLGTDGGGKDKLIVHNGAMRNCTEFAAEEVIDKSGNITSRNHLMMNGPDIFNFTIKNIPQAVSQCLSKNNITLEDIDFVIFHQANKYILEYLRKKTKIPESKFYINLENTGNTVSCTIPIAIQDCLNSKKIKAGDKVMLVGFGVGLSWAMTVVEI